MFVKGLHEAYLIEMPNIQRKVLQKMVLQVFRGKGAMESLSKGQITAAHLRKICNAIAALLYAYNNRANLKTEECVAYVNELQEFCEKYGFIWT
ncbi:unnamed protein product [Strongylus vulgaris]|uniref:Uncharacterized protein n=1 Tax=Strongylus vulgaris TaxID=40348 RepID=A0A3P7IJ82_STRVU|nr:unnamed protein product [Strongylus vulgaris]